MKFLFHFLKIGLTMENFSHDGNIAEAKDRLYTGCPRRNVPDFGRVFLMLKYTDITQNTYTVYPKLNGYGDNGQRKVGASCGSKYCNLHS
jgi:hypothetical protein